MNPEKDETIKRLLDDSREMIQRFEALAGDDRVEQISADVQKDTLEAFDDALEPAAEAFFDVFVEDDAMSVVAEFRPPAGGGKPLELDQIEKALFSREVAHGILWEEVKRALDACNLDLKVQTGVVIARGTPPVPYVAEHIQLTERATGEAVPAAEDSASVDFKEITPFIMVQKGDLLAVRIAEAFGLPGTDVLGREVPFPTEKRAVWSPGDNVTDTPVGYEAALDGRLVLTPPKFAVNPVLELKEGVDYRTGNIRFKGEIILLGKVAAGFSVEAAGGLVCSDVLDAWMVKTGGDVTTPGGIIGNGDGRLEIGGSVSAKFLEHVYLLSQGSVMAETCVLNSVVKTRGRLQLGDKGILAGGQIHTLDGVNVYQISTATGPRTELFIGLDYLGMERILWIRERSKELHVQLKKVDAAIPYGGTRVAELQAAAKKLRIEIVQLTETARDQLMKLGQNEEATVIVRGKVYPGTLIEICHVQFHVNQTMNAVKFFLDKRKGIIGVEPLTPAEAKGPTPSGSARKKR